MAEKMTLEQRIQHFLTLAQDASATQDERDLASSQAERLMIKHAIDPDTLAQATVREEKIVVSTIVFRSGLRKTEALGAMAIVKALNLRTFYSSYTRGYYDDHLDAASGDWDKIDYGSARKPALVVSVVGYEADVAQAQRLVSSLLVQGAVATKQWWKTAKPDFNATPAVQRRSYLDGFFRGAARRIADERKVAVSEIPESGAIVLVDRSRKVDAFVDSTYKLGTGRSTMQSSALARSAGYSEGLQAGTGTRGLGMGRALGR